MLGSNFLRSLVRDMVSAADDLEIVGELNDEPGAELELLDAAVRLRPDFVIVAVKEPELADVHLKLLEQRPRMKVLAVAGAGHEALLWKLQPTRELVGSMSSERLLKEIRADNWESASVS